MKKKKFGKKTGSLSKTLKGRTTGEGDIGNNTKKGEKFSYKETVHPRQDIVGLGGEEGGGF